MQVFEYIGETSPDAQGGWWNQFVDRVQHLVLPTMTLALFAMAGYSRYQRNAMLDVLGQDFIRTARAKGLTRRQALFKHGLRTALIPMATLFAYGIAGLVTGAVFVEKIFGWHGIGEWTVQGIATQDTNIVVGGDRVRGAMVLLGGLLSDVIYALLDPGCGSDDPTEARRRRCRPKGLDRQLNSRRGGTLVLAAVPAQRARGGRAHPAGGDVRRLLPAAVRSCRTTTRDLDYSALQEPPSPHHLFGTNSLGQDLFAQTLRGMQKSMLIGVCVAFISATIAATVGSVAGYFGAWRDRVLMVLVDLLLVVPSFILIAIITPRTKQSGTIFWLIILLAGFGWMISSRMVRGLTLSLRDREFVRRHGIWEFQTTRIITRHILPNVASILIIDTALNVGIAILAETGLSFLGFGVQPPDVSLGTLIADGTPSATTFPWVFLFPAGVLVVITFCANLVGDGLRDAFDPSSQRLREAQAVTRPEALRASGPPQAGGAPTSQPLLEVTDLTVTFPSDPSTSRRCVA